MGMNLPGTISNEVLSYVALLFVDDGDFPTIAPNGNKMDDVVHQHQKTVTAWSKYLQVTGGSLSSQKCFWYPIQWEWNNGHASIISAKKICHEIYIINSDKLNTKISKYDSNESQEVMGIWQSPLGTMNKQQDIIKQKIRKWQTNIENGYLPRSQIWCAFWSILWASIRYLLRTLTLPSPNETTLFNSLYKQLLPRMGILPTLPLVYRYGISLHCGLGLPQLSLESTI